MTKVNYNKCISSPTSKHHDAEAPENFLLKEAKNQDSKVKGAGSVRRVVILLANL